MGLRGMQGIAWCPQTKQQAEALGRMSLVPACWAPASRAPARPGEVRAPAGQGARAPCHLPEARDPAPRSPALRAPPGQYLIWGLLWVQRLLPSTSRNENPGQLRTLGHGLRIPLAPSRAGAEHGLESFPRVGVSQALEASRRVAPGLRIDAGPLHGKPLVCGWKSARAFLPAACELSCSAVTSRLLPALKATPALGSSPRPAPTGQARRSPGSFSRATSPGLW